MQEAWRTQDDIDYLTIPAWEEMGARILFTSRRGGESQGPFSELNLAVHVGDYEQRVWANRREVLRLIDRRLEDMVCCEQVHGDQVAFVFREQRGKGSRRHDDALTGVDGLVTATPGLVLGTFYADCIPVFLFDPVRRVIGLSHSGWKGTLASIAVKTIQVMHEQGGTSPEQVQVFIGPGISACCFTIQPDLADKVARAFPYDHDIIRVDNDRITWDLKETIRKSLLFAGVPAGNILVSNQCTACCPDRFFSYRREGGVTGRMAAMAVLVDGDHDEVQDYGG